MKCCKKKKDCKKKQRRCKTNVSNRSSNVNKINININTKSAKRRQRQKDRKSQSQLQQPRPLSNVPIQPMLGGTYPSETRNLIDDIMRANPSRFQNLQLEQMRLDDNRAINMRTNNNQINIPPTKTTDIFEQRRKQREEQEQISASESKDKDLGSSNQMRQIENNTQPNYLESLFGPKMEQMRVPMDRNVDLGYNLTDQTDLPPQRNSFNILPPDVPPAEESGSSLNYFEEDDDEDDESVEDVKMPIATTRSMARKKIEEDEKDQRMYNENQANAARPYPASFFPEDDEYQGPVTRSMSNPASERFAPWFANR